jgi:murein L,D-transpeptidase YafK
MYVRGLRSSLNVAAAMLLATFTCVPAQQAYSGSSDALPEPEATSEFVSGNPLLIRLFKKESQLELWMRKGNRFELYATYPVCFWSGTLGPKEYEGDRQAPEGFYAVDARHLGAVGRHHHALDIGFPNAFDRSLGRTGSYILLHGGCGSVGCFAMTDPVMDQIYALAEQALRAGQDQIPVHIFPFRMTEANLQLYSNNKWYGFWSNLKQGYDAFEATRMPPVVAMCRGSYVVDAPGDGGQPTGPAAPEGCAIQLPTVAGSNNRRAVATTGIPIPHAARARGMLPGAPSPPIGPVAGVRPLPRDNVAECVRLWTRDTGVSQQYWTTICKQLDFQPKTTVRAAHRSLRSAHPPRT